MSTFAELYRQAIEEFRKSVETFLTDRAMDPTTFGKKAMKDPKFVFELREGRDPSQRTMEKVQTFMAEYVAEGKDAA